MFNTISSNESGVLLRLFFKKDHPDAASTMFHIRKFRLNNDVSMQAKGVISFDKVNPQIVEYALSQNYPNPFNAETQLNLELAENGHVLAEIYNIAGQEIIRLIDDNLTAGHKLLKWNGRDKYGNSAKSGIYLMRLTINGESGDSISFSRRLILMK